MTSKIDSVPSYVRERISREGTRPMSDLLDLALKARGGLEPFVNGPTAVLIQIADVLLGEGGGG